jgi:hypothetical protein
MSVTALEQQLDRIMSGWRTIAANPDWPRWLRACNPATGRVRTEEIDFADAQQVAAALKRFDFEMRGGWPIREIGQRGSQPALPWLSRARILELYSEHRRGLWKGREAEWRAVEEAIVAAGREGRIQNPQPITKNRGWDGF